MLEHWRLFTKRGQPKRTWGACFGSRKDRDVAWEEYLPIRQNVMDKGLVIEHCIPNPKGATKTTEETTTEHTENALQHTRAAAEAAAALLASPEDAADPGDKARDQIDTIMDLLYKRITKGKNAEE
ncbi:hypothetical protein KFL_000920020 [Klebsormidium nitens]|uniref:Uncharacterized protein n=1 Tax=Klebsormidium nitens TaxID=105231 RepID=A0A0U9HR00_KLENI|nr:hypothetical protein KFL_000920020 [Klebsormidium nitens]|eukprot:GAQ81817.1 hypothetical protein KFL_000920020 [Klebsormidium nitens]